MLSYRVSVEFHSYRTAQVMGRFFQMEFKSGDEIDRLRKELVGESKGRIDNHTCFSVTHENGIKLYIQFSDWTMYVGSEIVIETW